MFGCTHATIYLAGYIKVSEVPEEAAPLYTYTYRFGRVGIINGFASQVIAVQPSAYAGL